MCTNLIIWISKSAFLLFCWISKTCYLSHCSELYKMFINLYYGKIDSKVDRVLVRDKIRDAHFVQSRSKEMIIKCSLYPTQICRMIFLLCIPAQNFKKFCRYLWHSCVAVHITIIILIPKFIFLGILALFNFELWPYIECIRLVMNSLY